MPRFVEKKISYCDDCPCLLWRLDGSFCIKLQKYITKKPDGFISIPKECPLPIALEDDDAEIS